MSSRKIAVKLSNLESALNTHNYPNVEEKLMVLGQKLISFPKPIVKKKKRIFN